MAGYVSPSALDAELDYIKTNTNALYICSALPSTRTEAVTTYALGSKSSPSIGSIGAGSPNGRAFVIAAFTDGSVTATGNATHYALVSGSALLFADDLADTYGVTSGNLFSLPAVTIRNPSDVT